MIKNLLLILGVSMTIPVMAANERLIVVNEGTWQSDNGRLSYVEDNRLVSNEWFRQENGHKLGDNPSDIVGINDNLIAIAVRGSDLIQWIDAKGKAVGETGDLFNIRCLATDGQYVYVTSYAHECILPNGTKNFQKGFVAKVDARTMEVVAAAETGYEPEGIAYHNGYIYVANSGGYSFQEDHDYETTIYIYKASDLSRTKVIDTHRPNLYGRMSVAGKYLCVNSSGNYNDLKGCGVIVDCEKALSQPEASYAIIPYVTTYNCSVGTEKFYAVGSEYSFISGGYEYTCLTIDPAEVLASSGRSGYETTLPGTMVRDIQAMKSPYGIYCNPYTGSLYATDAGDFNSAGTLYSWSADGIVQGTQRLYINPGWFLALRPDGYNAVEEIVEETPKDAAIFDLTGCRVDNPVKGAIYIKNGKKIVW